MSILARTKSIVNTFSPRSIKIKRSLGSIMLGRYRMFSWNSEYIRSYTSRSWDFWTFIRIANWTYRIIEAGSHWRENSNKRPFVILSDVLLQSFSGMPSSFAVSDISIPKRTGPEVDNAHITLQQVLWRLTQWSIRMVTYLPFTW